MKKFLAWLKSILHWLVEWRLFCFGLLVVLGVPGAFILFVGACEAAFRYAGMVLQLMGIGTVAWGIHTTRKEFGHPSVFADWSKRVNRFPPFGGRGVTGSAHITVPVGTVSARGHSSVVAGANPTIDERVQALEEHLKLVNDRVSQTQNEMDQEFRRQCDALNQEQQVRSDEDQHIRKKMESTQTGGLHISAMGALWLFIGVIMSSIPSGLAGWLK